nr:lymphocyte-specific protein 1-like [Symphalangus syndactylus]
MHMASTKIWWEIGEMQALSVTKSLPCKDVVAGDMSKKSLWEQKGGSKSSSTIKSTPSGKRCMFVATRHEKYDKVLVEGGQVPWAWAQIWGQGTSEGLMVLSARSHGARR